MKCMAFYTYNVILPIYGVVYVDLFLAVFVLHITPDYN